MNFKINRNIKNTVFSILDTLFLPLLMLLVTPIFITNLGMENYGKWMLINSLVVAMSVLNIGGVDTLIKYISNYRSSNDVLSINEIFSTVFVSQLLFAFIFVVCSFYLPPLLIDSSLFNIGAEKKLEFEVALQYGILIFALKLLEQVLFAYFKAYERYDISSILSILSKFLLISIQVGTVLFGGALDDVFKSSFILLCIVVCLELFYMKYLKTDLSFIVDFKIKRIVEVFHFTKWSWGISLIGTIAGQMDRWILAGLANMKTLGLYSLTLLVFNNLHAITSSSVGWVFPKVASENNTNTIFQYYCKLQGLLLFSSILISFLLITFDGIFYLWLDNDTYDSVIEYIHMVLLFLPIYSLGILPFYIVKAKGYINHNFYSDIITLIIRIVAIFILYKYLGLLGVVIAVGLSGVFISIYLSIVMKIKVLPTHELSISKILIIPLLYLGAMLASHVFIKVSLVLVMCYFFYSVFSLHLSQLFKKSEF
jgi:O-antigen/teichoic acid export membrane protein